MSGSFQRKPYKADDWQVLSTLDEECANRLLFDWWSDDDDRAALLKDLRGQPGPLKFPSRAAWQAEPAPPYGAPAPQGFEPAYLVTDPVQVGLILNTPQVYSNVPYTLLGGGSFLLGQDPPAASSKLVDWHGEQKCFIQAALGAYTPGAFGRLAEIVVDQAALVSLANSEFDLAEFAEQAALRFFGLLYGYAFFDHPMLEAASAATYRGLQYAALGRHFVTEPGALPEAQQALGALIGRTSALMEDYYRLQRSPRAYGLAFKRTWPDGVQPYSELDLDACLKAPLLKRAIGISSRLSGRDRAIVLATLLAGTVGNVRTAVCDIVSRFAGGRPPDGAEIDALCWRGVSAQPPLPVVPRRTVQVASLGNICIPAETELLVVLPACSQLAAAPTKSPPASRCPYPWGQNDQANAVHACLGVALTMPLVEALVRRVAALPRLSRVLDPVDLSTCKIQRLWGFGAQSLPLSYDRTRRCRQSNLIASFRVAPPIDANAMKLRSLIAAAAPRVRDLLSNYRGVHFAWFEFTDGDECLVLRTIYDGQFDAYIRYFAQRAGDLFDGLFEFLLDGPPSPVSEFPDEFVESIRRHNGAPVADYLFSAYPGVAVPNIRTAK